MKKTILLGIFALAYAFSSAVKADVSLSISPKTAF